MNKIKQILINSNNVRKWALKGTAADEKLSGKPVNGKMFEAHVIKCPCCNEKFMLTDYKIIKPGK